MIKISDKCVGCNKCIPVCPFAALKIENAKAVVNSACTLCGACVPVCPVNAIAMPEETTASVDLSAYKGYWVFVEMIEEKGEVKPRKVSLELLTKARELAGKLGEEVSAILIAKDNAKYYDILSQYGASKIYSIDKPELAEYNTDRFSFIINKLVAKYKPNAILYPSTFVGRDVAPRVAAESFAGLTADCTSLSIKDGVLLRQTRPAFGGNIIADILCPNHRPQMATVRPNVFKNETLAEYQPAQIIEEPITFPDYVNRVKIIEKKHEDACSIEKLDEAEVVISGGRGMKDAAGFAMLDELANSLAGGVGASRAAIDLKFKPKDKQVGQSGWTVSPKLYVACGISGAVQHIVGMENSETIIAINKDVSAPIFNVCKYGLVGDAKQILQKVLEGIKADK